MDRRNSLSLFLLTGDLWMILGSVQDLPKGKIYIKLT